MLVDLTYDTNITCIGSLIYIFSFFIMCFFKNSTMGDQELLNALFEMLRNRQAKDNSTMLHEVSLKIMIFVFNYYRFPTI